MQRSEDRMFLSNNSHLQPLALLASQMTKALGERHVSVELAQLLRELLPETGYVSVTLVASARGGTLELQEYYNLLQPGLQSTHSSFTTTRSVAAEVILSNQNRWYEANQSSWFSDFRLLKLLFDCSQVLCVPLHCHSKLQVSLPESLANHPPCPHCGAQMGAQGEAVGCITVGIKNGCTISLRHTLSKLVILGNLVGPGILATKEPTNNPAPPEVAVSCPPVSPPNDWSSIVAASTRPLPSCLSAPAVNPNHLLSMALQSSWYAASLAGSTPSVMPSLGLPGMPHSAAAQLPLPADAALSSLLSLDGHCPNQLSTQSLPGPVPERAVVEPRGHSLDMGLLQKMYPVLDASQISAINAFLAAHGMPSVDETSSQQGRGGLAALEDPPIGTGAGDAMQQVMALISLLGTQQGAPTNNMPCQGRP